MQTFKTKTKHKGVVLQIYSGEYLAYAPSEFSRGEFLPTTLENAKVFNDGFIDASAMCNAMREWGSAKPIQVEMEVETITKVKVGDEVKNPISLEAFKKTRGY